jgi:hypothetical protein
MYILESFVCTRWTIYSPLMASSGCHCHREEDYLTVIAIPDWNLRLSLAASQWWHWLSHYGYIWCASLSLPYWLSTLLSTYSTSLFVSTFAYPTQTDYTALGLENPHKNLSIDGVIINRVFSFYSVFRDRQNICSFYLKGQLQLV